MLTIIENPVLYTETICSNSIEGFESISISMIYWFKFT